MPLVIGSICRDKDVLICWYNIHPLYNYFKQNKEQINKIIIGNETNDVAPFVLYHSKKAKKGILYACSIKPINYDISKCLFADITLKSGIREKLKIDIDSHFPLHMKKPLSDKTLANDNLMFKLFLRFSSVRFDSLLNGALYSSEFCQG